MILGAISSTDKKDLRSAIHPDTIKYLLDMGIEVIFESGAGDGISATDSKFEKIGAKSKSRHDCISSSDGRNDYKSKCCWKESGFLSTNKCEPKSWISCFDSFKDTICN